MMGAALLWWLHGRSHTGPPQLMMSFTADGQLDPALLQERDKMFNLDTAKIRESRADWAANKPTPHPAADHPWVTGKAWTTTMQLQEAKLGGGPAAAEAEAAERGDDQPLSTQPAKEEPPSMEGLSLGKAP